MKTHKDSKSPEHRAWKAMRTRATNPNISGARWYSLKGVKCCKRWEKYENFLADMGRKPTPKHTLDRINNDGDYEPGNCRWATPSEQMINTTKNRRITFRGVTKTISQWESEYGIRGCQLYARINRGWSIQKALTTPVKKAKTVSMTDAAKIRALAGKLTYRQIGRQFSVHYNTVGEIIRHQGRWK